jgi:TRAP-type mannitol/chloroaromatic compound transport system substrate-binding protein
VATGCNQESGTKKTSKLDEWDTNINTLWTMKTVFDDSVHSSILYQAPQMVCNLVLEISGGEFDIQLERSGETEEILEEVSKGDLECGYSSIYYGSARYRALFFSSAIPFGLTPEEQDAWLDYKKSENDPLTFVQFVYEKVGLNIISFPAGSTGGQMGGWFKKPVNSLEKLDGLVMRIPGLGAEVLQRLGVTPHGSLSANITIEEAVERLKDGRFDAVEWIGPHDDMALGLHEVAPYYYYPGWWEPSTTFNVQVNKDKWNSLPKKYQNIFKAACYQTHMKIKTEYQHKNSEALAKLRQSNTKIVKFSNEILAAAKQKTEALLRIDSEQDEVFKEVYEEWNRFKNKIRKWSELT